MNNHKLREEIQKNRSEYFHRFLALMKQDPDISDHHKEYPNWPNYLQELTEKEGSLMGGILGAIEDLLEK